MPLPLVLPGLVALIGVAIKVLAVYAVTRILLALGLSYVAVQGFDQMEGFFMTAIQDNFGALPVAVFEVLSLAGVDVFITIIFSCITVRLIMNGLAQGVIGTLAFRGITNSVT